MTTVELAELTLPEFGLPAVEPQVPPETYRARVEAARRRARAAGLDALVIYGDREHFANLAYLTRYDPRFEEALFILAEGRLPTLVVGNEGWDYAEGSPVRHNRVLYQTLSLLGQPRDASPSLESIFRQEGIGPGKRVGVVGWKYFDARETPSPDLWLDAPAFLVDTLREIVGDRRAVVNATHLFMDPTDGLRAVNEVDQLAVFEFGATHASQAMRNVIFGLRPGMTGYDAVRLMGLNGIPLSAHIVFVCGPDGLSLSGPSMRKIALGDPLVFAAPLWGGLSARGGFVAHDASELPEGIRDYVEKLVAPYFAAIVAWYERIGIGVTGGELYDIIHARIGDPFFGVKLNPGHLIHLEEWLHSPVYKGSDRPLKSGMAIQVDVIPATGTPYFTTNIEDTIALADDALRAEFARRYPEAWGRVQARRRFMEESIGIRLKPEVLPFSNIPAYLPPFFLSPRKAMRVVR